MRAYFTVRSKAHKELICYIVIMNKAYLILFKGPGAFKIACWIILQLNVVSLYSERDLKSAFTHSNEYQLTGIPYTALSCLKTNWLVGH